jgi:hypothetical protein
MIDMAMAAGVAGDAFGGGARSGFGFKELVIFAGVFLTVASATMFWAVKWALDRNTEALAKRFAALDTRFTELSRDLKEDKDQLHRVERDFMQLKADLPIAYLRKEDAIRHEAVVMAKLDALAAEVRSNNKMGKS